MPAMAPLLTCRVVMPASMEMFKGVIAYVGARLLFPTCSVRDTPFVKFAPVWEMNTVPVPPSKHLFAVESGVVDPPIAVIWLVCMLSWWHVTATRPPPPAASAFVVEP